MKIVRFAQKNRQLNNSAKRLPPISLQPTPARLLRPLSVGLGTPVSAKPLLPQLDARPTAELLKSWTYKSSAVKNRSHAKFSDFPLTLYPLLFGFRVTLLLSFFLCASLVSILPLLPAGSSVIYEVATCCTTTPLQHRATPC